MAQIQFYLIKKIKIGRPEHSLTIHPLPPSKCTSYVYHTLYFDISISFHINILPKTFHKEFYAKKWILWELIFKVCENSNFYFHWKGLMGNGEAQKLSCTVIPFMNYVPTALIWNRSRIKIYLISSRSAFNLVDLKVSNKST